MKLEKQSNNWKIEFPIKYGITENYLIQLPKIEKKLIESSKYNLKKFWSISYGNKFKTQYH